MLNGNCMYSSMSLLLVGDNSLVEELRCLTSIELYLNSDYYGKHDVFQSAYLSQKEPKRSPESFFYLSMKNDTLDSNLKNKEDTVKREAILNCQNFAWSSFMCMLGLSSAIKGKIISHYPDGGDAMYRGLINQAIFPRIQNSQQKAFNLLFCRCEPLGNFRKFEKSQTNHFVPLFQCRRSKVNTNSKPSAKKMRMEFPKMDFFVSKVPSKQSKLQFQPCQKSKCSVKSINLSFPSTSTCTSKDKNVTNSISENNVSSSSGTSLNPSLKLSLAREEISSNSVTPAAQPSLFSSRDFFSSNKAFSDSTSSATEPICFSSNLSVISKPSDIENIASDIEHDESSIDFSKILGCKKDVSTLTKLKNLSNAEKLKLMRSVFVPSKSYVFPVTVRHFKYDWLEQYPWLCY